MNKIAIWVVFSVLVITATILTIYHLSQPSEEPTNIEECKLQAWKDCGLPMVGNQSKWCYHIEGTSPEEYSECQNISQSMADCWVNASNWCFNEFIVKIAEEKKNG